MSQAKKTPTYNLKVVLQRTGIKPDTLRAWERRYGLPLPQRTAGGHRLYSQYDIEMIKWLMERQEEGMRINRAIDLFRSIEAGGKDPLDDTHPVGLSELVAEQPMVAWISLDEIRTKWVEACLAYDESRAEQILSQSFALYTVELVCLEVLQLGIVDIGERWYRGEATVQQEHFTSSLVIRRLNALIAASPAPTRPEKIVVGCPAQEEHVMAALMTTLFLRRHGWDVIYLGANVPLTDLEQAVEGTAARLVILVASQLHTAANLFTAAHKLQSLGITLAFAGSIFTRQDDLDRNIPGYYLGDRLDRVVQEVEAGLKLTASSFSIHVPRSEYQLAKTQIEDHQSIIKADIWNELNSNGSIDHSLWIASDALLQDIISALTLDNLDSLRNEVEWVKTLITHQALAPTLLPELLRVCAESIDRQAGDEAKLVSSWLREAANQQEMR
jgi:DNA-binding transcriptional MerR regulator/methylmalonyl-CoA mutase cobalamin-binding subunit